MQRCVKVLKQLGDKEMAYARTNVVSKAPRKGRSRSPYKRGSKSKSDSEQDEVHDTALLAMDEDPRQKRNVLKRRLLERRAFIAGRVRIPQGTNKNRRKPMAGTNLVYRKCDERTRKGLDQSRNNEWKNTWTLVPLLKSKDRSWTNSSREGIK